MGTVKTGVMLRRVYAELVRRRARVRIHQASDGSDSDPPLFVVGIYRSGTSLVRYVLDSHSQLACPPESDFLSDLALLVADGRSRQGLDAMGYDADHVRGRIAVFARYFYDNYARSQGKTRWADKTPGYIDHLDFLSSVFPDAKYFVLHRNPLDQIDSITRGGLHLDERILSDHRAGEDYRVAAARYWVSRTRRVLEFVPTAEGRVITARYEDMCAAPEETFRRIFGFIDLEWEPAVLEYHRFPHDTGMESGRALGTRGFSVSTGRYEKWPDPVRADVERIVGPTRLKLGYEMMT